MKVRKVDELGRVVLPREAREMLSIVGGDDLNISWEDGKIVITKANPQDWSKLKSK